MFKKLVIAFLLAIFALPAAVHAQQKPKLMVLPAKSWCSDKGYGKWTEPNGKKRFEPDYYEAFTKDADLRAAVGTINKIFSDRGFPLIDYMAQLESSEEDDAEDEFMEDLATSDADAAAGGKKRDMADIRLELDWTKEANPLRYTVRYTFDAVDAFANDKPATVSMTSQPFPTSTPFSAAIQTCIESQASEFEGKLVDRFQDILQNGRICRMNVRVKNSSDINLESPVNGTTVGALIYNWLHENTVNHSFNQKFSSPNKSEYDQVRMAMTTSTGMNQTMQIFAEKLKTYLASQGIDAVVHGTSHPGFVTVAIQGSR